MIRYLFFPFIMLIASCSDKVNFQPDSTKLPDAIAGEYYSAKINATFMSGNRFYFTNNNTKVRITPSDGSLNISPDLNIKCAKDCGYHENFIISGHPSQRGIIQIDISIYTVSTMYSSGELISKKYLLIVK